MQPRYDILNEEPSGDFLWLEAASSLEAAAARVEALSAMFSGRIIVFDQQLQMTISVAECRRTTA